MFHAGRLNLVDTAVPASCGCPPPEIPVMRASAAPPPVLSDGKAPSSMRLAQAGDESRAGLPSGSDRLSGVTLPGEAAALPPETAPLPPSKPNDVHVQVEAPFVFRATDLPASNRPAPKPAPIPDAGLLPVRDLPRPATFQPEVLPPTQTQAKAAHHGVFGRIRGFFSAIFG